MSPVRSAEGILVPMTRRAKTLSSGVVVLHETVQGRRYLLLRAYRHWDFPKGMVEEGETPLEAAIREVEEETCLTDLDFAWGKDYVETGPYSHGKVARYYIARTATTEVELPINPELGHPEHNAYRWVDYSQACRLTSPRVREVLEWAAEILTKT